MKSSLIILIPNRSNAFEVSNNGHSIVYDNLGVLSNGTTVTNPISPSTFGATYQDNIIYAWGDIPPGSPGPVIPVSSFGLADPLAVPPNNAVQFTAPNTYIITLNNAPSSTDGNAATALTQSSVTATPSYPFATENPTACITILVSPVSGNKFKVWTFRNCLPTAESFMFKVTGRR